MTGSNWSLRRIVASNLSVLHNIDSKVFIQRLVKGKLPEPSQLTADQQRKQFDYGRFTKLFHMCYEEIKITRKNQERANRMLKGVLASTLSSSSLKSNDICLPSLNDQDREVIKNFSKRYGDLLRKEADLQTVVASSTTQTSINNAIRSIKHLITSPYC